MGKTTEPSPALLKALNAIRGHKLEAFWDRRLRSSGVHQDELFKRLTDELEYAIDVLMRYVGVVSAVDANHAGLKFLFEKRDAWEQLIKDSREVMERLGQHPKELSP